MNISQSKRGGVLVQVTNLNQHTSLPLQKGFKFMAMLRSLWVTSANIAPKKFPERGAETLSFIDIRLFAQFIN